MFSGPSGLDVFDFAGLIGLVLRLLVAEWVFDLEMLRLRREGMMWTILNQELLLLGGSCQVPVVASEEGLWDGLSCTTAVGDVGE